jgi:radical S-adenosyl methionine domain-containing protein 2
MTDETDQYVLETKAQQVAEPSLSALRPTTITLPATLATVITLVVVGVTYFIIRHWQRQQRRLPVVVPESVNYHFTRQCNYQCGFCFHTAKSSFLLPIEEAKRGLRLLKDAGMVKINFNGGEPFLPEGGRYLGTLVKFCKQELGLQSVSVVSNGSLIRETWFEHYGEYLDILAVSCDSFNSDTNEKIGRRVGSQDHIQSLRRVRDWCTAYRVAFKLNTVVNSCNKDDDMTWEIRQLNPCRWKVFQCLLIDGENAGPDAKRNAERYVVTDEEFEAFLQRHKDIECLVPESNNSMRYSYVIVDEYMRFLDGGTKKPSRSILDVGVHDAIDAANFDAKKFLERGGKYVWSKADMQLDW